MIVTYTALFDANVLYPAPLRDLLMWMAMEDIFLARWTQSLPKTVGRLRPFADLL